MQPPQWPTISLRFHHRRRNLMAASACIALLGVICGCNRPSATPAARAAAPESPDVAVVKPTKKDVRRPIERPGYNIEAYERTALYARIGGYVQKWTADIGDRVRKDEVLAELSVPEMDAELRQKEASIRQATSEIEQAKATVQRAEAEQDRTKSQYERMTQVEKRGVLDKEQLDEVRLAFKAAQANLLKANADVGVAEARLEVTKADRDHTQSLLQYAKIRAPFDGIVTQRRISTGDMVQPASSSKGDALFVVERVDTVRVFVNVQELEAVWVHDGDSVLIRPQSLPGQQIKANVTRTSRALNPQNRTLHTEIDLPNAGGKLLPGMYVNVTIMVEHKNVWTLPASAVFMQGEQSYCYGVENGKAVRIPVQIGMRNETLVEILKRVTSPVKSDGSATWGDVTGDEVIVENAPSIMKDGQEVNIAAGKK